MRLKQLYSDIDRQKWLAQAIKAVNFSPGFGSGLLTDTLINRLTAQQATFNAAYDDKQNVLAVRHQHVLLADKALNNLKNLCRTLRRTLKSRAAIMDHTTEIYKLFGMTLEGRFTEPATRYDWLNLAETLIQGDAKAVNRGYPPLEYPSATLLTTAVDNLRNAMTAVDDAQLNHQDALEIMLQQRASVDALHADVLAFLRFVLRPMATSRRREVMRRYGYEFTGEAPTETNEGNGVGTPPEPTEEPTGSTGDPGSPGGSGGPVDDTGEPAITGDPTDGDPDPTDTGEPAINPETAPQPDRVGA